MEWSDRILPAFAARLASPAYHSGGHERQTAFIRRGLACLRQPACGRARCLLTGTFPGRQVLSNKYDWPGERPKGVGRCLAAGRCRSGRRRAGYIRQGACGTGSALPAAEERLRRRSSILDTLLVECRRALDGLGYVVSHICRKKRGRYWAPQLGLGPAAEEIGDGGVVGAHGSRRYGESKCWSMS